MRAASERPSSLLFSAFGSRQAEARRGHAVLVAGARRGTRRDAREQPPMGQLFLVLDEHPARGKVRHGHPWQSLLSCPTRQ